MITRYKPSRVIAHAPNKQKPNAEVDNTQRGPLVRVVSMRWREVFSSWHATGSDVFVLWVPDPHRVSLNRLVTILSCRLFMSLNNVFRKLFIISLVLSSNACGRRDENTRCRWVSLPSSTKLHRHRACGAKATLENVSSKKKKNSDVACLHWLSTWAIQQFISIRVNQ